MQICRGKLLIYKLTPPLLPSSLSILDVQAIEKTKEIALRGEESVSALSAQRLLCMSASSDTNYASAGRMCLNVRPPLQPTPPHLTQLPPATTILHPTSAPLHSHPNALLPPQSSTRLQKLSIARFICVSHYRKWNVVPAKRINSVVGEISLLLYGALTLSHLNLWWRWEPSSGASGLGDGGSCAIVKKKGGESLMFQPPFEIFKSLSICSIFCVRKCWQNEFLHSRVLC